MKSYKLPGRIENLYWNPPILRFEIERHGGTVLGSTRAEIQKWDLNVENRTANLTRTSYRQIKSRQKNLNVKPIAKEIAKIIVNKEIDEWLRWSKDGSVHVKIGKIIPENSALQQTVANRRKRFRKELDELLKRKGWINIYNNHYKQAKGGGVQY